MQVTPGPTDGYLADGEAHEAGARHVPVAPGSGVTTQGVETEGTGATQTAPGNAGGHVLTGIRKNDAVGTGVNAGGA